jgi:hypothetical protein
MGQVGVVEAVAVALQIEESVVAEFGGSAIPDEDAQSKRAGRLSLPSVRSMASGEDQQGDSDQDQHDGDDQFHSGREHMGCRGESMNEREHTRDREDETQPKVVPRRHLSIVFRTP